MQTVIRLVGALVLLVSASCEGAPAGDREAPTPEGPPRVRPSVVQRHARELDEQLAERPAGSDEELAASSYLLAHLQGAGYSVRLDYVPIQDLVRSTNLVASASDDTPRAVVVVPYDTPRGGEPRTGASVGFFLELARALTVAEPDHAVAFAAIGAEHARVGGGTLGSRRLVTLFAEDGWDPAVIVVGKVERGDRVAAQGTRPAARIGRTADELGVEYREEADPCCEPRSASVFREAGFDTALISGDPGALGRVLLGYLTAD